MGQTSLPVMNRTGLSTFWQSVWDDKYNYNRGWKEDNLIRKLVPYFILYKSTKSRHLLNSNTFKYSYIINKVKNTYVFDYPDEIVDIVEDWFLGKKIYKRYILKIWIIKFQTWFVFFFKIYTPQYKKKKPVKNQKKSKNKLGFYYRYLAYNFYNKNYLNNNNYNKYNF